MNGFTGLTLGTLIAAFAIHPLGLNARIADFSAVQHRAERPRGCRARVRADRAREPSEQDEGYVTLANVKYDAQGNVTESDKVTGQWAWKHPHTDGSGTDYKPVHRRRGVRGRCVSAVCPIR